MHYSLNALLKSAFVALAVSATFAGSASATPAWFFEGKELTGMEEIVGGSQPNSESTIPGLGITCAGFLEMTISNSAGVGKGNVIGLPLAGCFTNSAVCTVDAVELEGLPWSSNLTTVKTSNYVVLKDVEVGLLLGGEECVLSEMVIPIEGTAGGVYDNETEIATFNPTTMSATGTELSAFGMEVLWTGVFPFRAIGPRSGEALTIQ